MSGTVIHGETNTRLYRIWDAMRRRGTRKHAKACYAGVTNCAEWDTYPPFAAWAKANGYRDDLTLDRKDGAKHYYPENCRWVTYTVQNRNRRGVRFNETDVTYIRQKYSDGCMQKDLATEFGCAPSQISTICSGKRWAA